MISYGNEAVTWHFIKTEDKKSGLFAGTHSNRLFEPETDKIGKVNKSQSMEPINRYFQKNFPYFAFIVLQTYIM